MDTNDRKCCWWVIDPSYDGSIKRKPLNTPRRPYVKRFSQRLANKRAQALKQVEKKTQNSKELTSTVTQELEKQEISFEAELTAAVEKEIEKQPFSCDIYSVIQNEMEIDGVLDFVGFNFNQCLS